MKVCTKCHECKSFDEFHKGTGRNGLHSWCRACVSNNYKARYVPKPRIKKPFSIEKERERKRLVQARYRAEGKIDKEKNREHQARYRERHKDEIKKRHQLHVEANRDKIRMRMSNVKAQRRMAEGRVSTKEWKAILMFYGNRCGICNVSASELPMTVDHFIPLSRNGTNTWDNVWPLCMPCNVKKRAQIPDASKPPHVEIFQKTGTFN